MSNISVTVVRPPANKQGDDIADPLISSKAQALQRGRREIDEHSTNRFEVSGTMPLGSYMKPCELVQVTDVQKGNYKARLRNWSTRITRQENGNFIAVSSVVLEREV